MKEANKMSKKKKKKGAKPFECKDNFLFESDENFYFVAGYTGGFAYGITWEEAIEEGLIKREELEQEDDDLPF